MHEVKQNTATWIGVRVRDALGVPVSGVVASDVIVSVRKADGTLTDLYLTPENWAELTTGAFTATGVYSMRIPASAANVKGPLLYAVKTGDGETFLGTVNVVAIAPYVSFTGGGETVNPVIYQAVALQRNSLRVVFSEAVVMTTGTNGALRLGNYLIEGLVVGAVMQESPSRVIITTSPQTPGVVYTLTVLNVEDLNGNPIASA